MTAKVGGRRRGAPRKAPDEALSHVVTVRVTPAEFATLQAEAARAGRPQAVGRYLHDRAMGRRQAVIPAINREMWSHLGKWAGAFTTIANAAAGERLGLLAPHLDPSLPICLQRVTAELRALRLALIGLDAESMQAAAEAERLGGERNGNDDEEGDEEGALHAPAERGDR